MMKSLLAVLALSTALSFPAVAMAKPVTFDVTYGGTIKTPMGVKAGFKAKTTINRFTTALHALGSHMDAEQNVLTALTEDYREGTTAFRERRKPRFTGR